MIDTVVSRNNPAIVFSDVDATTVLELIDTEVRPVSREGVAVLMSKYCQFLAMRQAGPKPQYQPQLLISAVAVLLPRRLPILNGLKTSPFFFDGNLVTLSDEYHAPSGYYCRMADDIDTNLDVEECLRRLDDVFGQFPYVQGSDKANTYGVMVGQVLKAQFSGPMAFFDKPASQTGATLLAQTIASIADGQEPEFMTPGERPEETDKRLIAALNMRPSSLVVDNVSTRLSSDVIASGMTARYIGGRLLGGNKLPRVPTASLQIYITGNNASIERDLINRSINVRLDSGKENPEERTDFRHSLPDAALEHRRYYLSSVVSLVQRWIDAGCPRGMDQCLTDTRTGCGPWAEYSTLRA